MGNRIKKMHLARITEGEMKAQQLVKYCFKMRAAPRQNRASVRRFIELHYEKVK